MPSATAAVAKTESKPAPAAQRAEPRAHDLIRALRAQPSQARVAEHESNRRAQLAMARGELVHLKSLHRNDDAAVVAKSIVRLEADELVFDGAARRDAILPALEHEERLATEDAKQRARLYELGRHATRSLLTPETYDELRKLEQQAHEYQRYRAEATNARRELDELVPPLIATRRQALRTTVTALRGLVTIADVQIVEAVKPLVAQFSLALSRLEERIQSKPWSELEKTAAKLTEKTGFSR